MIRRNEASERQVQAASPAASTWLAANAGSGKTKVLTDRVARLLLAGTEPQKVLCLTYTKAAATEMQNRLLKRLGEWAMLEDANLRGQLAELGEEEALSSDDLARARRLFAQAIETPGGLKIQTIHAFCGGLLRRFPLEAGVPHGFAELDERSSVRLREEVLEEIASGEGRPALDAVLEQFGGEDLLGLIAEISKNRDCFSAQIDEAALRNTLGLPQGLSMPGLVREVFSGGEADLAASLIPLLRRESKTMVALAETLAGLDLRAPNETTLQGLFGVFLTQKDEPRARLLTKDAEKAIGEALAEEFRALGERAFAARQHHLSLEALARAQALHGFARVLLPRLSEKKACGGWLDFDDLIVKAGDLLSDPSVAQWVLFRLDGGIDHILVDEAQDTSPGQWKVIERLADEFTSGDGARAQRRTIFVVGDRKQSIYSFQGADLARFEAMQSHFSEKFAAIQQPLQNAALLHSFRSSMAILRLVDLTFSQAGAEGLGGAPEHFAFHETMPGRVDLWPSVPQPAKPEADNWEDPVDLPGEDSTHVVLARAIAAEIRAMIAAGVHLPAKDGARAVHEGDFLILVQRRSALFFEIIRACKEAGLAVAGADRLRLGGELAVKDIVSVLAFLATPEDDLSLASALRSPLFGWSEDELYRLAQPREGYLWQALRAQSDKAEQTVEILRDLLDHTDFLRPYDLIERLLTRHDGRRRLMARLGAEAEEGIDELIAQALAYERSEVPSLTGFLTWLGADEIDIKRQLESAGRAIRVMTVHGSKGLEAPIVILPDTAKPRAPRAAEIGRGAGDVALWRGGTAPALQALREDELERTRHERLRLLYVAMTRAEKWLIVATAGEADAGEESWFSLVAEGMKKAGTETVLAFSEPLRALGAVQRFSHGNWPANGANAGVQPLEPVPLPDWVARRPPAAIAGLAVVSASNLGGAKALPGEAALLDSEAAMRRGRQLHLLLEHLPEQPAGTWRELAQDLLGSGDDAADLADIETILAEAQRVLAVVEAQGFLGPDTLAEVELGATLPELGGMRLRGVIDRLKVEPHRVRVIDYKSNVVVPRDTSEVPLGLLRQMAAYRGALRQIYPGRAIELALLWTATGQIMWLDDAQLDAALRTPTLS